MQAEKTQPWIQRVAALDAYPEPVRIHYIECEPLATQECKGTIVLLHGFPQTSYQFRHVIRPLAETGYRVIAPDYRGAGRSSKPSNGFTKAQMAEDVYHLVFRHLKLDEESKIHLVGHDIGGMIAHAFAFRYPGRVASIVWGECPLPGTASYYRDKGLVQQFHFMFHAVPDLPEALVSGRERIYLAHFFDKISYNAAAISDADLDHYVLSYSQPGALRCAFAVYAAFEDDAKWNKEWLARNGRSSVPALALSGDRSRHAEEAGDGERDV
ncbi:hypothetical protein H2203_004349 [Taxawa tesnikishii (nom. ined.)]|nr:hypothetical protein H2203_004349 [Dothideales sp. JES 119]